MTAFSTRNDQHQIAFFHSLILVISLCFTYSLGLIVFYVKRVTVQTELVRILLWAYTERMNPLIDFVTSWL